MNGQQAIAYHSVTFTGGLLQRVMVHHTHRAGDVFDRSKVLQTAGGNRHCGPVRPKHGSQKVVRDGKQTRVDPVDRHQ